MIIAPENFRDEELLDTKDVLENHGVEVDIASTISESKGMLGATVKVDLNIDSVSIDNYDAVIFVGGTGSAIYFTDEKALSIAKEAFDKGKITAAICIAPSILANAGILKDKKVTSYVSESSNLEEKGAVYTGSDVEIDENIITANGPQSARMFGEAISKNL